MNKKKILYTILFFALILLFGCRSKIDFTKSKPETSQGLTSIETISSFKLRFNPKANGVIVVTLSNGAEYKAEKLNTSQLSSLLTLLQSKDLQFDTQNEEFILNK